MGHEEGKQEERRTGQGKSRDVTGAGMYRTRQT